MSEGKRNLYTAKDKRILLDLIAERKAVLLQKKGDFHSLSAKNAAWEELTVAYNCSAEMNRTTSQLKTLWKNIRMRSKDERVKEKLERYNSGAIKTDSKLVTEISQKVKDLQDAIDPFNGVDDSDTTYHVPVHVELITSEDLEFQWETAGNGHHQPVTDGEPSDTVASNDEMQPSPGPSKKSPPTPKTVPLKRLRKNCLARSLAVRKRMLNNELPIQPTQQNILVEELKILQTRRNNEEKQTELLALQIENAKIKQAQLKKKLEICNIKLDLLHKNNRH